MRGFHTSVEYMCACVLVAVQEETCQKAFVWEKRNYQWKMTMIFAQKNERAINHIMGVRKRGAESATFKVNEESPFSFFFCECASKRG